MAGKHNKTSNNDWILFQEAIQADYSEGMYVRLLTRLINRDGFVNTLKN
jgi:hypothetical protein